MLPSLLQRASLAAAIARMAAAWAGRAAALIASDSAWVKYVAPAVALEPLEPSLELAVAPAEEASDEDPPPPADEPHPDRRRRATAVAAARRSTP